MAATYPLTQGRAMLDVTFFLPGLPPSSGVVASAMVDTGSNVSVIQPYIAQALGATPAQTGTVTGADGQPIPSDIYRLGMDAGDAGLVQTWPWYTAPLGPSQFGDALIGDDLVSRGVFLEMGGSFMLLVGSAAPRTAASSGVSPWFAVAIAALAISTYSLGQLTAPAIARRRAA